MGKNDNIFIKLQIEKDDQFGNLTLGVYFDKNAPNFSSEKDTLNWSPTIQEIDFIVETFEMLSKRLDKNHIYNNKKQNSINSLPTPTIEETPSFNNDTKIEKTESLEIKNNAEEKPLKSNSDREEVKEKIFIQAEEEIIDEALSRNKGEPAEEFMVEVDEKTIIDKVLKQKLKNKK